MRNKQYLELLTATDGVLELPRLAGSIAAWVCRPGGYRFTVGFCLGLSDLSDAKSKFVGAQM